MSYSLKRFSTLKKSYNWWQVSTGKMNANPLSGYLCRYGTVGTNSEGERMSERHFYATGALLPYSLNCYHGEI
jgi:hypothetical protein